MSSPKAYRLLKSFFIWPHKSTLLKVVDKDLMNTGLNEPMLKFLNNLNLENNILTLLLDEVSLKPSFKYHSPSGMLF